MDTPEHDKLRDVKSKSQAIHEFVLEFLSEKGIFLAKYDNRDRAYPIPTQATDLIAEFLDIDLKKLEEEKLAMLDELRAAHGS